MIKYILLLITTPVLLLALNMPTNLQVRTLSETSVSLDWSDNSNEIGFKIFRDGRLIALTPANTTHFEDNDLQPHTKYTYMIYATDYVEPEIFPEKSIYKVGEAIKMHFHYCNDIKWFALFPLNEPDENYQIASWYRLDGNPSIGTKIWDGRNEAGYYELRAYDNDDNKVAVFAFKVEANPTKKKLIMTGGIGWEPSMAPNLITREHIIMNLPFDGYGVVANRSSSLVMTTRTLTYDYLMDETLEDYPQKFRDLAGRYPGKDMFLKMNLLYVGDLWDDAPWERVTANFAVLAKVMKDIGFKGIIFDDEAYNAQAEKMTNFKFPTKQEVTDHPENYAQWEKNGADYAFVDEKAYRNPNYTFAEHMEKTIQRYQAIMEAMVSEYPDIDVIVYHGSMIGHPGTYDKDLHHGHKLSDGNRRYYEFKGPMMVGLKRGIGGTNAAIHDMGEQYAYRTDEQFARTYAWRKYYMAKSTTVYDVPLDPSYEWMIPVADRENWKDHVHVGHMVENYTFSYTNPEYDMHHNTSIDDVKNDISMALALSDEYVIYYCQQQEWLKPGYEGHPYVGTLWEDMIREAIQQ